MPMMIMSDQRKNDDTDLILAESFLNGEDEMPISGDGADMMLKDQMLDSVRDLKVAFESGSEDRLYKALTGFMDTYMQSREIAESQSSDESGEDDYGF